MFGSSTWVAHLVLRTVRATKHDGPYVCYGREQPFAGGSHLERTHPTTGSAPAHETCCLDNALASQLRTLSERICPGTPRRMNRSESTSMTSIDLSRRDT